MGIKRDFFTKPIVVPITLLNNRHNEDGSVSQERMKITFTLRREKYREVVENAIASILNADMIDDFRLHQFCNLLIEAPAGFDDFPNDGRELRERARDYFSGEEFEPLIRAVMVFYEQSTSLFETPRSV